MEMWTVSLGPEMDFGRTLNPSMSYAELFAFCWGGVGIQFSSDPQRSSRFPKELEPLIHSNSCLKNLRGNVARIPYGWL